ncbi:unnamed protein product [Protopolystoma xenopodis]|uniref:Uncharacterized protein n=1 Tax=Protopolystoma xenopodis TaxID=117903 RepID=A0A3S5AKJ9_9PLAT|nr:unnamed protein product [Protopolystoma xenopodis]
MKPASARGRLPPVSPFSRHDPMRRKVIQRAGSLTKEFSCERGHTPSVLLQEDCSLPHEHLAKCRAHKSVSSISLIFF